MATNQYFWNKTLKFSWGHIIAFLAVVFISYVMYMGTFYQNGGDFTSAAIKVAIVDILLFVSFIGAQYVKAADEKFDRSIIIERILVCFWPFVFAYAMNSYNHFWSVFEQRKQIESHFSSSIEGAKQMFLAYDKYAENRIKTYEDNLDAVLVARKNGDATMYKKSGFTGVNDHLKKKNFVQTLHLQLCSQNTDSLKTVATKWIDDSNRGASVWNAFLVGNIGQIDAAIKSWNTTLQGYSEPKMSNESVRGNMVYTFDPDGAFLTSARSGIISLEEIYTKTAGVSVYTIWTGIILFFMLFFPYYLQKRNTRAKDFYFLNPWKKPKANKGYVPSRSMHHYQSKDMDEDYLEIHRGAAKKMPDNNIYMGEF